MNDNNNGNGTMNTRAKALTASALENTIQSIPRPGQMRWLGANGLLMRLQGKASAAPPWYNVHAFDAFTEEHVIAEETFLASAIAIVATQYSARTFFVDGPKRTVNSVMDMFERSKNSTGDMGMTNVFLSLTQDIKMRCNGAFLGIKPYDFNYDWISSLGAIEKYKPAEKALELSKRGKLPPVEALEHLDSTCCYRTGNPLYPVLYRDPENGNTLWLPWHMVAPITELPFPKVKYRGIQLCAVARILRAAQIMSSHEIYKLEKITGRSPDDMILFSGVNRQEVKDQLAYEDEEADSEQLMRWQDAALVFGINPERPATATTLSLKSEGGFDDIDKELQWYIVALANAMLESYQTFAPLQAGNLGNSQQSIVLAEGAAGRGPALWEKMITQLMHQHAIVPRNCEFKFGEKSIRHETDKWALVNSQLEAMKKLKTDLAVPDKVVYQIMADNDIVLNDEYLAMLGERDTTDDVTVADDDQQPETLDVAPVVELAKPALTETQKALEQLSERLKEQERDELGRFVGDGGGGGATSTRPENPVRGERGFYTQASEFASELPAPTEHKRIKRTESGRVKYSFERNGTGASDDKNAVDMELEETGKGTGLFNLVWSSYQGGTGAGKKKVTTVKRGIDLRDGTTLANAIMDQATHIDDGEFVFENGFDNPLGNKSYSFEISITYEGNALKTLTLLHRSFKASQAEIIIQEFSDEVHNAVQGYVDKTYNKRDAQAAFLRAINTAWEDMGPTAYDAGGGDWAEVEEETAQELEDDTQAQIDYALGYWDALPDIRDENAEPPDARTEYYVSSLRGLYAKFKAYGAGNPMLTFILGEAHDHCEDDSVKGTHGCINLNGQRYSYKKWEKMGIQPATPGSNTTCGGFNCLCYFQSDDGERWGIE